MDSKKTPVYKYGLSWLTFVKAVWNEKLVLAAVAITLIGISGFRIARLPAVYKAEALVLVDTQKIPERFVSSTITAEVQDRLTTISQEILSSTRLNTIISDFNLYAERRQTHVQEEIVQMMREDVEVKVERAGGGNRPGAFRISYQGSDPFVVAQVTNRIANLYIEENLRSREVQAAGTSEFIEQQLLEAKNHLDELEASVSRYKIQHNGELPQQEVFLAGALARLQSELNGAQDGINRAEQSKIMLQNSLAGAESAEAMLARSLRVRVSSESGATSGAGALVELPRSPSPVDQLIERLRNLRARYSDEHPEVKGVMRDLEVARAAEVRERAPRPDTRAGPRLSETSQPNVPEQALLVAQYQQARERSAGLRAQLTVVEREIATRQSDRRRIIADMSTYQTRLERLPLREQEMAALTRDYDISKQNYRSLLDKKIAAGMASALEHRQKAEKFTILDPARIPEKPAKPNRPVLYAGAAVFSFALGIAAAIAKGLAGDRILGEWDLPQDVAVLGRVPPIEPTAAEMTGAQAPPARNQAKHRWLPWTALVLLAVAAPMFSGTLCW